MVSIEWSERWLCWLAIRKFSELLQPGAAKASESIPPTYITHAPLTNFALFVSVFCLRFLCLILAFAQEELQSIFATVLKRNISQAKWTPELELS